MTFSLMSLAVVTRNLVFMIEYILISLLNLFYIDANKLCDIISLTIL